MKSAVPRTPMATLGAAAPSGPAETFNGRIESTSPDGRLAPSAPSDAANVPMIVVAGAPRCGKSSVTNALLGTSTSRPAGGPVVDLPTTSAYVNFRHGEELRAYAYVPGRRAPRLLSVEQLRAGDSGMFARGGPGRPPRRVVVLHPAELLRHVSLVDTPGAGGFDEAYAEIVLDALDHGGGLLFVTEASTALGSAQLDFLAEVEQRGVPVTFVLTKIDSCPQWPAVLSANQKLVHDHAPRLATAPWYAVSTLRGADDASPAAAVEEAARGLAGLSLGALRRGLTEPAPGERSPRQAGAPGRTGVPAPAPAPRVAAGATDAHWTELLNQEIRAGGINTARYLAMDLEAIQLRCARETDSPEGRARLAYAVDRELHALSVRLTRAVDEVATEIMRKVFGEILEVPPDRAAVERVRGGARRAVEAAERGEPEWDRALLVTATGGVAVSAGGGAVASLSAIEPRPIDAQLLPPVGVGLSATCYSARGHDVDGSRCRGWLAKTMRTLEVDLGCELAQRFEYLHEALAVVAADTVDHGVLLA
ncbi:hypothetical protein HC028_21010 [Planosporangium flavigriseum]|uniref:Dynamin N-terminal domain-containing protein n=1 Tax=Planosporangium flavigriseum TaxID=373681 RepID=A0A8J3LUT0_9ACTN|nr:dynamin family protein [Planosporangium flavigriseum]NJC66964.1 hypothetical protein [Planosporangium flavigriseum]GIG73971.1 hypothetical protein Pfl04_23750 [Planosporangium flavigriseum]